MPLARRALVLLFTAGPAGRLFERPATATATGCGAGGVPGGADAGLGTRCRRRIPLTGIRSRLDWCASL
ncbi:hypothetical protein ACWEOE_00635 [Amycolatopsis sp. NPDC004368]